MPEKGKLPDGRANGQKLQLFQKKTSEIFRIVPSSPGCPSAMDPYYSLGLAWQKACRVITLQLCTEKKLLESLFGLARQKASRVISLRHEENALRVTTMHGKAQTRTARCTARHKHEQYDARPSTQQNSRC